MSSPVMTVVFLSVMGAGAGVAGFLSSFLTSSFLAGSFLSLSWAGARTATSATSSSATFQDVQRFMSGPLIVYGRSPRSCSSFTLAFSVGRDKRIFRSRNRSAAGVVEEPSRQADVDQMHLADPLLCPFPDE